MTVYFLHAILRRHIRVPALNTTLISSWPSNTTKELYLGNLTLTKIQSINSETPCVHVDRCSETYEWNRSINLIGHIWHPYFSEHTGIAECVRVSKNLQSNSQQQNNLRPELFWGMSGVDLKITTIRDSGISGYKSERFTGKTRFFLGWTCYTCENTSLFSCKSRVLHTFGVCAPTGVYKMRGAPRSSHYFAFSKILSTIYVYGDGNATCVHTRNFIKKGGSLQESCRSLSLCCSWPCQICWLTDGMLTYPWNVLKI